MDAKELQLPTQEEIDDESGIDIINIQTVCRLCATSSERLLGIFGEEGVANDLANKVNLYLPIKVAENDELPLQCCCNCASTILAWHEFVINSVESERKFRSCHLLVKEKSITGYPLFDNENDNNGMEAEPLITSLNEFCQTDVTPESVSPLKKIVKHPERKRKQDVCFYPSQEASAMENITDIEQHFILGPALTDDPESIPEYKVDVEPGHILEGQNDVKKLESLDSIDPPAFKAEEENEITYSGCQHCSAVFVMKRDALNHIQKDHPGLELSVTSVVDPMGDLKNLEQSLKNARRKNNKIDQDMTNAAKVVVDGRIYYNCKECGKSLHSPYTYVWHMRIHTGERPFVCDLCGKQFRVSQGLVRHLRETHQGIKRFPCDLCGRMFATRRNVEEHRRIHTNERPYVCDLCGKSFKQKASLFVHKRSHKNYFPFKCSYCNQGFRTKPPLMIHITRHTGEKPYKCDICGRCFRIKYELKRHKLIHSDEKPFVCNVCGLSFRQKRYLRNHVKSNHSVPTGS